MDKLTATLIFSAFNRKYPFWTNLVRKIKIVGLNYNLVPTRGSSSFPLCAHWFVNIKDNHETK